MTPNPSPAITQARDAAEVSDLHAVLRSHGASDHLIRAVDRIFSRAIDEAARGERSRILALIAQQKAVFSSDEYATPQPIGSIMERFACDQIVAAIQGDQS